MYDTMKAVVSNPPWENDKSNSFIKFSRVPERWIVSFSFEARWWMGRGRFNDSWQLQIVMTDINSRCCSLSQNMVFQILHVYKTSQYAAYFQVKRITK